MSILIVVNNPRDWPLDVPGVTVVPARAYLTDPAYGERPLRPGVQPVQVLPLPEPRLLRLAAGRGARPQAAAPRQHHRGPAIAEPGAAAHRGPGRADPEIAGADQVGHVRTQHLLRPQRGEPPRRAEPPAVQPAAGAAAARRFRASRRSSGASAACGRSPPATSRRRTRNSRSQAATEYFMGRRRRTRKRVAAALRPRHPARPRQSRAGIQCPGDAEIREGRAGAGHARGVHHPRRLSAGWPSSTPCSSATPPLSTTTPTASPGGRPPKGWW